MKTLSRKIMDISEYKLNFRGVIIILLLTAFYFVCFFYLSQKVRYVLFAGMIFITVFMVKPKPGFWLPILPLIFIAGGPTIPTGDFNPAISTIIMMVFTFFFIADRILWNEPLFVPSRYLFFFFIAIFIQICSVFISIHLNGQYPPNAIRDGSSLFLFFPLAVIIPYICKTESKFNKLLRAVLIALLVASAIGVMQYFSVTSFSRVDINFGYLFRARIASLFGNPNIFAGYLEMGIPIAIALFFREKSMKWKITAVATIVLGVLSVLYTFSRGGLFCSFIGCGITLLYVFRSKVLIPVFLAVVAVLTLISYADTFERQMAFFMNPTAHMTQPTILHRFVSYRGFLNQFAESPVTGVGWGARNFYWGRSRIYSFWEVRSCVSTEKILQFGGLNSLFLNHAVKGGLISLAAVLLVFATIFAALFRAIKKGGGVIAVAIGAGIFSFMTHQIIDNTLRYPTINSQFWILSGLLLVLVKSFSEESDTDTDKNLHSLQLDDSKNSFQSQ